ncbi:MAG: hypothetical protein FWC87_03285, partial [Acidimicrobiaceae bacterium]|nr:hypothetical protein [Acidimicrobiaceae bacterium]
VRVDGGRIFRPAISNYFSEAVGTPSVDSSVTGDVYLTLAQPPSATDPEAVIGVIVEPLVSWIWVGGGVILVGSALAAFPGRRRRRPTDPVSSTPSESAPDTVDELLAETPAGAQT